LNLIQPTSNQQMKTSKLLIAVAAVAAVATGSYAATRGGSGGAGLPPLHTVVVDRGDVSQRVVAHGAVQPVEMVTVGSQVSGIVEALLVDFNSPVRRGQVVARLESSTFRAAVNSAVAEVEAAEAGLEMALGQWDRIQRLRAQNLVPPSEVDQARLTVRQAEALLSVRRHALDRARQELERATIRSPTDGIVISRDVDVGQTVAASLSAPVLFQIATDLGEMRIHANVSEADIGVVREGQPVRFRVDSHRDRRFMGAVIQVRNAPLVVDNVVHYETIIAVENEEGLLKPGMTAEVEVITAEVQDAVRARNTSLRARLPDHLTPPDPEPVGGSNGRVYVLRDGRIQAVPVRTGLSDGVHTELLAGVQAGDTLVIGLSVQAADDGGGRRSFLRGNQAQY
jgi:HlyD family secretion protein